jgi:hypothetical protein
VSLPTNVSALNVLLEGSFAAHGRGLFGHGD